MKPAVFALAMLGWAAAASSPMPGAAGDFAPPSGLRLLPVADGPPEPAPGPVGAFLRAADANDVAGMGAVLDRDGARFLASIRNCYLRRVYSNEQSHEIVAAWMCAEGANRSRVVLANVAVTSANKVSVSIQLDNTNNRPAPPRTGSAFAE